MGRQLAGIPLTVGVTGHRDLSGETQEKLYDAVYALFCDLRERYPETRVQALSSLAAGADTVCARAALAAGCALIVPLPMPAEEYRNDFSKEELREFDALLQRAERVFTVQPYEDAPGDVPRGFYYRQAGIYVTRHSHILFACWDGACALQKEGGGTYETVKLMLEQPFSHMEDAGFAYCGGRVLHIATPRQSAPPPGRPFELALMDGPERKVLDKPALAVKEFRYIEDFNRDVGAYGTLLSKNAAQSEFGCIDEQLQCTMNEDEDAMLRAYAAADVLALHFQKRRVLALRILALLGLLFVLFFLFYDELNAPAMLIGYGVLIGIAVVAYLFFTKKRFHDKYVLYRVLAEAMRIQLYMELANVREFAFHIPWWKQTAEMRFVEDACRVMRKTEWDAEQPCDIRLLQQCWIGPQARYHEGAIAKKGGRNDWNQRMARVLLIAAVGVFAIVAVIEAFFPWVMAREMPNFFKAVFPFLENPLTWSALFKIILGAVSAAAAFLANYYGKLALAEQVRGSRRMHRLYTEAGVKLAEAAREDGDRAARRILALLARAALEENLDWYTYNADNAPEFLID